MVSPGGFRQPTQPLVSSSTSVIPLGCVAPASLGPTNHCRIPAGYRGPKSHSVWDKADSCREVKNLNSEVSRPGFRSQLFLSLYDPGRAPWPLYASVFLICETGIITVPSS